MINEHNSEIRQQLRAANRHARDYERSIGVAKPEQSRELAHLKYNAGILGALIEIGTSIHRLNTRFDEHDYRDDYQKFVDEQS